ncbi:MAG: hypothetical protein J0H92_19395 [Sphingobacteriales bacterium]|nr:hypothetical protein [Sphingobacteriales bacterium]OJW32088.1 MAG: hypothetical protein BGO54_16880 [Sphingobacteriales bacterium 46-32]
MRRRQKMEVYARIKRELFKILAEERREILWILLKENITGRPYKITWLVDEMGVFLDEESRKIDDRLNGEL